MSPSGSGVLAGQFCAPDAHFLLHRWNPVLSDGCSNSQGVPGLPQRFYFGILVEVTLDMDEIAVTP